MPHILTVSLAVVFCALAAPTFAQLPAQEPVATAPPSDARYELIQNSRALKETYLLDRYSGDSWQLVQSTKRFVWQRVQRESHDQDFVPKDWTGPAYQISISGLAAKGTFLINVLTGATWVLFEDPKEGLFWGVIPAPK